MSDAWRATGHPARSVTAPVVAGYRFLVRCPCGYAHDSAADDAVAAIADVQDTRHPPCGAPGIWTATEYPRG